MSKTHDSWEDGFLPTAQPETFKAGAPSEKECTATDHVFPPTIHCACGFITRRTRSVEVGAPSAPPDPVEQEPINGLSQYYLRRIRALEARLADAMGEVMAFQVGAPCADPTRIPCRECGGTGVVTRDIIVDTEHSTDEYPCDHCKDTGGYEPVAAPSAETPPPPHALEEKLRAAISALYRYRTLPHGGKALVTIELEFIAVLNDLVTLRETSGLPSAPPEPQEKDTP